MAITAAVLAWSLSGAAPSAAAAQVPMQNPGFETGDLTGWTTWGQVDGVERSGEWFGGILAHGGDYFLGTAASGATKNGGVYQQVAVTPNASCTISAWYFIYWVGGGASSRECWLGVDPNGGTNPTSANVLWEGPGTEPVEYGGGSWHELRLEDVTAGPGGTITVFLKHVQQHSETWNINCLDDASVEDVGSGESSTVNLRSGWNMISLPLQPEDPAPEVVFADCVAVGNTIGGNLHRYHWSADYQVYPLDFTTMEVGRGYWLHLTYAATNTIAGLQIGDKRVGLDEGWNFIGYPSPEAMSYSAVSVTLGTDVVSIQEAVSQGWLSPAFFYYDGMTYRIAGPHPWYDDDALRPWYGYWVYAYVPGTELRFEGVCSDGTPYGACSATAPLYCDNGVLVSNCAVCGCPLGYECRPDGGCYSPPPPPQKSKLSVQTSFQGSYAMQFIQGARPTVVKLLGHWEMADDIKAASPDTKIVGRIYLSHQPMDGDPAVRAQEWWADTQDTILAYPDVDYWEGYNEPGNLGPSEMAWYATFEQTRVDLLAQHGQKACIGQFATGNITTPDQDPSAWQAFAPALDAAKQHGGILGLHEYGCPMGCAFEAGDGEGWLCGRYRKVYRYYLIPAGKTIPLVVTEGGVDAVGGVAGCCNCWGWRTCYSWAEYRDQLAWYDGLLREDDYVLGFTIFALEISGWDTFDIGDPNLMAWLIDYVGESGGG